MNFRSGLVDVSYPDEILRSPINAFSIDSQKVSTFDPQKHNSILVSTFVRQDFDAISIPQMASYITHFRLRDPVSKVVLHINGELMKTWDSPVANMWYNIYDYPLNIYLAPYGQRFLFVSSDKKPHVEIQYIECDYDTHEKVITAAGLRK